MTRRKDPDKSPPSPIRVLHIGGMAPPTRMEDVLASRRREGVHHVEILLPHDFPSGSRERQNTPGLPEGRNRNAVKRHPRLLFSGTGHDMDIVSKLTKSLGELPHRIFNPTA